MEMEIGKEASASGCASAWGATLIRLPVATRQNQILIRNLTGDGQHCEDSLLCLPNWELFNLRRNCRLCLLLPLLLFLLPLLLLALLQLCSSVFVAVSVASVCVASAGFACLLSPASDISMFASHSPLPFLLATFCSSSPSSYCFSWSFFPLDQLCSVCFSRGSSRWQRLSPRGQWPVPVGVEHVFCSSSGGLFVPVPPSLFCPSSPFVLLNRK